MAVRKAVRAATTTFTAISIKRFFISYILLLTSYLLHQTSVYVAWVAAVASVVTTSGVVAVAGRYGTRAAASVGAATIRWIRGIRVRTATAVRGSVIWGFALGCGNLSLGLVREAELHVLLQLLTSEVTCRSWHPPPGCQSWPAQPCRSARRTGSRGRSPRRWP